jgi:hypothetical protein
MNAAGLLFFTCIAVLAGCGPDHDDGVADAAAPSAETAVDSAPEVTTDSSDTSQRCTGTATPCSALTFSACTAAGCTRQTRCIGSARSCATFDSTTCTLQLGCSWSTSTNTCTGTATPCDAVDEVSCSFQFGCDKQETCVGVVTPCESLAPQACATTAGCRFQ